MAQRNALPVTARARTPYIDKRPEDQPVHPLDDGLRAEVHRQLATFLQGKRDEALHIDPQFVAAVDSLSEFVLSGGKRLRPTFAWWGWRGA
ncbi:MAG: hypothetical protein M3325_17210, partial [Actinomycetota bacterium]|nr:hypothetical protein [Actinomycetota bacterium]